MNRGQAMSFCPTRNEYPKQKEGTGLEPKKKKTTDVKFECRR
jgi:hypothetical protein